MIPRTIEMLVVLFLIASFVSSGADAQSEGSVDEQGNVIVDMIKDVGNHILGNNTDGDINILASKRVAEIKKPRYNKKLKSKTKKKLHEFVAQATGSNWCTLQDIQDYPCKAGYIPREYCYPCSPGHGPPKPVAVADEGAGIMNQCSCGTYMKCLESCSRYDHTIFKTTCNILHPGGAKQEGCTRNANICKWKKFELGVVWADFLTNLIPNGKVGKAFLKKGKKKLLKNELQKEAGKALKRLRYEFMDALKEMVKDDSLLVENAFNDVFKEMSKLEAGSELKGEERGYFDAALEELVDFVMPLDYKELRRITDGPRCSQIITLDKSDLQWERPSGELENVAYSKPTSQSSNYDHKAYSKLAVDGDLNGDYYGDSVTHTNAENGKPSWWKVDLQGTYMIRYIHIYNRDDCCQDRLNGLLVEVKRNGSSVWTQRPNINSKYETIINCGSVIGDEVKLSVPSNAFLSLAEVEVIGKEHSPHYHDPDVPDM